MKPIHYLVRGIAVPLVALTFLASSYVCAADAPDMAPVAREVIARQIGRESQGLLELADFKLLESVTNKDVCVVKYSGQARLVRDASVWVENAPVGYTVIDLAHFEAVPQAEALKGEMRRSRVYQVWNKGTLFSFTGATGIRKFDEGWRAIGFYGSYHESAPVSLEASLNAAVEGKPAPAGYLVMRLGADGTITEVKSAKACIEIAPPTDTQIQDGFIEEMKDYGDGLYRVDRMEMTGCETEPQDGNGTYSYSYAEIKVSMVLLRAAVSFDGKSLVEAPNVGDKGPDDVWRMPSERTAAYWDAGSKFTFTTRLQFRKEKADTEWSRPTLGALYPENGALKSSRTMYVRYKMEESGKLLVTDVVVE